MSDKSAIEWTDATWNPTTGCDRVSPGCANCYALDLAARLQRMGVPGYEADGDPRTSGPGFGVTLHPERLGIPIAWTKARRIFVDSMSDLFHEQVPSAFVDEVVAVMALAPQHTFQVLTKRPERMRAYMATGRREAVQAVVDVRRPGTKVGRWPLPNVWLGTSVENARWRTRIDELRATPAVVRFLSCEPLLGPLVCPTCGGAGIGCRGPNGRGCIGALKLEGIAWVIAGGESGPNHRAVDADWVRTIRDTCDDQRVPFLFKQWGGKTSKAGGRTLDGRTHDDFPERLERVAIAS